MFSYSCYKSIHIFYKISKWTSKISKCLQDKMQKEKKANRKKSDD